MKKTLFFMMGIFVFMTGQSQISQSLQTDVAKLSIESAVDLGGYTCQVIKYDGENREGTLGTPVLPVITYKFILPDNVMVQNVSLSSVSTQEICLSSDVISSQPPVPASSAGGTSDYYAPDGAIYGSSVPYPANSLSVISDGYIDGDIHIVTVSFCPVIYYPASRKIEFIKSATINLNYGQIAAGEGESMAVLHPLNRNREERVATIKNYVCNKSDVSMFYPPAILSGRVSGICSVPFYEYCIITSRNLAPEFKRFVDWKKQKGLNAGVVCIEDILSDPAITGDRISGIYDDAGKLRQYLTMAFQNSVSCKYVLLAGDRNVMPFRYGTANYTPIPTDLYFSDLNSSWNTDNDKYYGEESDKIDVNPELFVGRIPFSSAAQVKEYTEKLIRYERPEDGLYAGRYFTKAFYFEADDMQARKDANLITTAFYPLFQDTVVFREKPSYNSYSPTFPTGTDIINEINRGNYGFISTFVHGSPEGLSSKTSGNHEYNTFGVCASDARLYIKYEQGGNIGLINKPKKPFVVYSMSCETMPYDVLDEYKSLPINVGEAFILNPNAAVAYLGNTRDGWIGPSEDLQKRFCREIVENQFHLGEAEALSKAHFSSTSWLKHWLLLTHNLFGCPETELWTAVPQKINNLAGQNVVVRGLFGNDNHIVKCAYDSISHTPLYNGNYTVSLFKHDYFPAFDLIKLQNELVHGEHYLFGNSFSMGKRVDVSKITGDFILDSDARLILESRGGTLTLDYGFEMKPGAVLDFKNQD